MMESPLVQLDYINVRASAAELVAVKRFYESILGLVDGARPPFAGKGHWLYSGSQPLVHLSESRNTPRSKPNGLDHVAFRVESIAPILRRLEEEGVPYERFRIEELGLTQLFVRDPVGNRLEINARET
jgi:catechol 2,3-dioxygenase-like lactoylglutathione lyase family enzyme